MNFPSDQYEEALQSANEPKILKDVAKQILPLIDLTSLSGEETAGDIATLCRKAITDYGHVAAVCIYIPFVSYAKSELVGKPVKVATVANFPSGSQPLDEVVKEIQQAILNGADEVDVVFPHEKFLSGDIEGTKEYLRTYRETCGKQVHLKVILETGAFPSPEKIYEASELTIDAGANFLKTSTGKIKVGATLEAASAMLVAIRNSEKPVGFKVSGGVRTTEQAAQYISIAEHVMGADWISPERFRIGASSLLDDVLEKIS